MRLIDADKLCFKGQHYSKSQLKAILDFIEEQPTAYVVDNVVEGLKELRDRFAKEDFHIRGIIEKSIEIVKAGGVNE